MDQCYSNMGLNEKLLDLKGTGKRDLKWPYVHVQDDNALSDLVKIRY